MVLLQMLTYMQGWGAPAPCMQCNSALFDVASDSQLLMFVKSSLNVSLDRIGSSSSQTLHALDCHF